MTDHPLFCDKMSGSVYKGGEVYIVFLEFSKIFDTTSHDISNKFFLFL